MSRVRGAEAAQASVVALWAAETAERGCRSTRRGLGRRKPRGAARCCWRTIRTATSTVEVVDALVPLVVQQALGSDGDDRGGGNNRGGGDGAGVHVSLLTRPMCQANDGGVTSRFLVPGTGQKDRLARASALMRAVRSATWL